ncbi:SAM-dependent methyltransferase [Legionella jordanis]|uniref:Methyltransferase n=1 Tax=Legionella jordanis TaxID=456 RepID=A0A0W0V8N4_9GAMM|nr:SAM-dependent methyltransferase [Legionella jordanis]KTD16494.1 methyltransferase [Legionella jordanis]RMX03959.1 SAM-dependent methyltransferase [Legionella jordanis]RMX21972.1 SAM-dependent methyltransferase [Legionella jordanis]VEH12046.1 methyltransferase [Legionella jordanis]HAT8712653.1 SAM-dependent methyltransferase [Legionella jordanis]
MNNQTISAAYLAKPEFLTELCEELKGHGTVYEDLLLSPDCKLDVCFAQDIWLKPTIVDFQSISEAVRILRQAGKFWYLHPLTHIRRSKLIEQQLRVYSKLSRHFPIQEEIPQVGAFSLLNQNTLIYSQKRLKRWPDGYCHFIEDKINPPSRAYLKLWEALSFLNRQPKPFETALDLGASPGGWTYVMQSLGTQVTAVDKARLDPKVARLPRVTFLQESAFSIEPGDLEQSYDWVLSDVACYPQRAYDLICKWLDSGKAGQLIFTIKLQGKTDLAMIEKFKAIPDSRIINLFYNKHEATFFYPFNPDQISC